MNIIVILSVVGLVSCACSNDLREKKSEKEEKKAAVNVKKSLKK